MKEQLKWQIWELKRLHRLWVKPEKSVVDLCRITGVFWLWRHGAKREVKIMIWPDRREWYSVDLAMPHKYKAVEADGGVHLSRGSADVVRDTRLRALGWAVLRVTTEDMKANPRKVRREVRRFLK